LALLRRPSVLLLDEPAAGLDLAATSSLIASFRRLRRGGLAFVIATRDLAFAQRLATRVVLLEAGSVIETLELQSSRQAHAADSYLGTLVG
jgi:ABC-type multidrug transport system ATPase subunit